MKTVYIRDVPADVTERLKEQAAEAGTSLSAYLAQELRVLAERPTRSQVVERLRNLEREGGPSRSEILEAIEGGRR